MPTHPKWKNHLREFVVILFGILLAFQLDRCYEEGSKQKLVNDHLEYMKEETEINLNNIKASIKLAESNLAKVDSTIQLAATQGDIQQIAINTYTLMNIGYLYIRENAYKSLINSGDIRYLKNFDDKKLIINLYEYYFWTKSFDLAHRDAFYADLFPYIKSHFDLVQGKLANESHYYSRAFLNALSTYRFTLNLKLNKFKDCQIEIEQFLEAMS